MSYLIIFLLFINQTPVKSSSADLPPEPANYAENRFNLAKQEAMRGNHKKVIEIIRPLLYPTSRFSSEDKEIQALRLLGLSFWFVNDLKNATQTFSVLLNRRPDFKLDPVLVPSGAITFFNNIKIKLKNKLEEIRRKKLEEELKRKKLEEELKRKKLEELKKHAPVIRQTVTIHKNYPVLALAPFGMGQFQNEQPVKGWVFFSIQALAATVSVSTYFYLKMKYPNGLVPSDKVDSARQLQYLQVGAGAIFFGAWFVGIADAFLNYKTDRVEKNSQLVKPGKYGFYGAPVDKGGMMFGFYGEF